MTLRHHLHQGVEMQVGGVGPFVTLRHYSHRGRRILWRSRQVRKGLVPHERGARADRIPVWQRQQYNWWTGLLFCIGAMLFMIGAALSIFPQVGPVTPSAMTIGIVFFLGSIPFTTAGYMQHFQAANAPRFHVDPDQVTTPARPALIGWHPHNIGWVSTFAQFVGTVLFNFNTFDAIDPASEWYMQDLTIWVPDVLGSILFLLSGYLAFIETSHGFWSVRVRDLDWWIVVINLMGCVFFMGSAITAFIPRGEEADWIIDLTNAQTWLGALCFFIGAALMMFESRQALENGETALAG